MNSIWNIKDWFWYVLDKGVWPVIRIFSNTWFFLVNDLKKFFNSSLRVCMGLDLATVLFGLFWLIILPVMVMWLAALGVFWFWIVNNC
jgi:hypothetical protein